MPPVDVTRPRASFADLERTPDDGRRYEIYDGEVSVVPAPLPRHQIVVLNLYDIFRASVAGHGGVVLVSPIDIVLSEYDVVQPDLVLFTPTRRRAVTLDAAIRTVPDLAIEILSPSTVATDRGRKMRLLERFGLPEYWLVDPGTSSLEVYRLSRSRLKLAGTFGPGQHVLSATLPGLSCPVHAIFRTALDGPAR
jgi:Uma2 family endonuclease